jgi:hypothetical protein
MGDYSDHIQHVLPPAYTPSKAILKLDEDGTVIFVNLADLMAPIVMKRFRQMDTGDIAGIVAQHEFVAWINEQIKTGSFCDETWRRLAVVGLTPINTTGCQIKLLDDKLRTAFRRAINLGL